VKASVYKACTPFSKGYPQADLGIKWITFWQQRDPVGAVLGLGGIPTIRALRSKVNRVQPYRRNAAQTKHRSHINFGIPA